jgi:hypothetical protein
MRKIETIGRVIRIGIGVWLIAAGVYYVSPVWIAGIFPLYTGITNKCPSFLPGGRSSCAINQDPSKTNPQKNSNSNS